MNANNDVDYYDEPRNQARAAACEAIARMRDLTDNAKFVTVPLFSKRLRAAVRSELHAAQLLSEYAGEVWADLLANRLSDLSTQSWPAGFLHWLEEYTAG